MPEEKEKEKEKVKEKEKEKDKDKDKEKDKDKNKEKVKSPKPKKAKPKVKPIDASGDATTTDARNEEGKKEVVKKKKIEPTSDDKSKSETAATDDKDKTKKPKSSRKSIKKPSSSDKKDGEKNSSDKKDGEKAEKKKSPSSRTSLKPKIKKQVDPIAAEVKVDPEKVVDPIAAEVQIVGTDDKEADSVAADEAGAKELDPNVCVITEDPEVDAPIRGSKCDHRFSIAALESHLTRPMKNPTEYDAYLGAPTLGRCPACHAELKLFEVRDAMTGEFFYERYYNLQATPLAGLVFKPREGEVQLGHFHFDTDFDKKDSHGMSLPYMNFVDAIEANQEKWMLNDGSQVPQRKWFEEGCHFHEPTRTFHGTIVFGNPRFQGAYQWDVTLAFTKDYAGINVGVIHKRMDRMVEVRDDMNYTQMHRYLYPLDGAWQLLWVNPAGEPKTGSVHVRGNEFQQGPYMFHLNFAEPDKPGFRWPLDPVYAVAKSGVDLIEEPMGPELGERIEWETTHPAFPEIVWVRESIGPEPVPSTIHFGQGTTNHYMSNVTADEATMYDSDPDASSPGDSSDDE
jgi:hypothetical protein